MSTTFSALADPTRRAILERLARDQASVGELAAPFDISLPAISRHLKVLEDARLIHREKDAQRRRCRLEGVALREAVDWLAQYRRFWEQRFDTLAGYLEDLHQDKEEHDHGETRREDDGPDSRRR